MLRAKHLIFPLSFCVFACAGEPLAIPEVSGISPPHRADRIWPGSEWAAGSLPDGSATGRALDEYLFTRTGDDRERAGIRTDAALIVHRGRIVYEKYARGYGPRSRHHAWSVAKSVTGALVGIAEAEGRLRREDELRSFYPELAADARGGIKVDHLLRFSSGLDWVEGYEFFPVNSSILAMLYSDPARDVGSFIISHKLKYIPGTRIQYSGGDSTLLLALLARRMEPDEYADFPWRALFDPLGMRDVVFGRDGRGVFIGSTSLYLSARDLARFGYLFLADGIWRGRRVLPAGWVQYSTTLAPAWNGETLVTRFAPVGVGAQWWLNCGNPYSGGRRAWPVAPRDTFASTGHWGQALFVIPSLDLVIVRFADDRDFLFDANRFLKLALRLVAAGPGAAP